MTRDSAKRPPSIAGATWALSAAWLLWLAAGSGCCLSAKVSCDRCSSEACPTYCPPQGDCFGYYATYWRRWPGDCHLWHPEMLPLAVEPVSAVTPTLAEQPEEMPSGTVAPVEPAPAPEPPQPPPVIIQPKGAESQALPQTMHAPPVELGPDALSRRRIAAPPQGGVIPVRYPAADVRRLDSERLARIGAASGPGAEIRR